MAEPEAEHGIHVLLLPNPSQGHINPILQFGKRLAARRGVRCTLAVTRFVLAQSGDGGGEQPATAGGGAVVHVAAVSDGCDRGGFDEAGGVAAYTARLEAAGSETVGALLRSEAERGRPVRVLVYDAFLPWAPRVARRRGAAAAAFFTQPCAVDVAYAHAFAGRIRPPLADDGEVALAELPGLPAGLRPADLPSFLAQPGDCPAYLDLLVNQFDGLDTADHVLVNSFAAATGMSLANGVVELILDMPIKIINKSIAVIFAKGIGLHGVHVEGEDSGSDRAVGLP